MSRGRRHRPIVPVAPKVTSRKHARRLTSAFHDITHRLDAATSEAERAVCQRELQEMGGVEQYQAASALNTALNPVSRWVQRALRKREGARLSNIRVLEIGAVNTQLLDAPGLIVRAIDLHSLHPRIEQCDFLSLPHGGELDEATGRMLPYDVVVCSMVLNCVPHERRRFDMLVGMRAQLRDGGRAFVTLPRSCVDHSLTLTEASFTDALAAVGLRRSVGDAAAKPPDSSKIVYFECEATLPCAAAAVRVQHARHEARRKLRAMARPPRNKSAGAAFDVDVGGHLGFGVRVPRSYAPAEAGRAAKEQAMCCAEFLRQGGDGSPSMSASNTSEGAEVNSRAGGRAAGAERGGGGDDSKATAASAAIERQLDRLVAARGASALDYSRWRWYPDAKEGERWREFGPGAQLPASDSSAQVRSGWSWTQNDGWVQSEPVVTAGEAEGDAWRSTEDGASTLVSAAAAPNTLQRGRKRGHPDEWRPPLPPRMEARLSSVSGCWWRRATYDRLNHLS